MALLSWYYYDYSLSKARHSSARPC